MSLADHIDALLPQTQCTRCGFPTCSDYARAVALGSTGLNRCAPGGLYTIERLAKVTGRPVTAPDPACGPQGPRQVAEVDEAWCIGCTLCIKACPVDAITGGARRLHAVIEQLCTGCELCLAPCPVDCIVMVPPTTGPATPADWLAERAREARQRFLARRARVDAARARAARRTAAQRDAAARRREIAAAVARARARRGEETAR